MNNIKSRMNSGSYNITKFKANEKDLREKIAFFEKKEEKGELKDYMYARMEEARAMYDQLLALKSGAPLPLPAAAAAAPAVVPTATAAVPKSQFDREQEEYANNQRNAAVESLFPGTLSSVPAQTRIKALPKMTLKKLNKQRREAEATALAAASYVPPAFNPPPPSPAALQAPYGHYNNGGVFHINGTVAPTAYNLGAGGYGTAFNNISTYRNAVPAVTAPPNKPTTTRRQRTPVPIYNEYYEQAVPQFLPLPELYDPYTGRKFAPEEDPMPPIESAYHELKNILKRAHLKAASLRKKAARATKRRTKGKKNRTTSFNAGLRIAIPPNNALPPTGQVLQPQENLFI